MVRGSPNPLHFGLPARLRKARKQLSQKRMVRSVRTGRELELASYVESGQRIPTVGTVSRLAAALGVNAGWLGYGLGDQPADNSPATTDGMGARVQALRIERRLTKVALARQVGVDHSTIANIEKGSQTGVDVLESLAKALGVSPAWLAFGEGPREIPKKRRVRTIRVQAAHADR